MTPELLSACEQQIQMLERWIESIRVEQDWRTRLIAAGDLSPFERAACEQRLTLLEPELVQVTLLLHGQQAVRNHFVFLLQVRPSTPRVRMVKAALPRRSERKRA